VVALVVGRKQLEAPAQEAAGGQKPLCEKAGRLSR
jgi:hypothetical protein